MKTNKTIHFFLTLAACITLVSSCQQAQEQKRGTKPVVEKPIVIPLAVGTYTRVEDHVDGKAEGVYLLDFNTETGELSNQITLKGSYNPSYVVQHPELDVIYAVNEIGGQGDGQPGLVDVFAKEDNIWKKIQTVISGGKWPCHVSMSKDTSNLFVSNYGGGWSRYVIRPDGKLEMSETMMNQYSPSKHPRQESSHVHMCLPVEDKVYVADLGANEVLAYTNQEDENNMVGSLKSESESGPRHFAVPNPGVFVYVLNELSNTIDVFNVRRMNKDLKPLQSLTSISRKPEQGKQAASAIKIHPSQRFLYTASRGIEGSKQHTIDLFAIGNFGAELTYQNSYDSKGWIPRDFTIDPTGKFLLVANQDSDNIYVYSINQKTGELTETSINYKIPTPVCLSF
jgi:6-phosphogluconolactonase